MLIAASLSCRSQLINVLFCLPLSLSISLQTFGEPSGAPDKPPLLLSIRSGARVSMPGMMDTVLNVGLNDEAVAQLARVTANERFAWDSYRRLVQMLGSVVLGVPNAVFDSIIERIRTDEGVSGDPAVSAAGWRTAVAEFKAAIARHGDGTRRFPEDPWDQVTLGIAAVFASWNGKRAIDYRNATGIPHSYGTAVNLQVMIFGNLNERSGSGVLFSRNPSTGERVLYGEYLTNAQGEDVVSGTRTPIPLARLGEVLPEAAAELARIVALLESHQRDMQDSEFTVQDGKLWMLQTRDGKRTARAAVRIAVDMVAEGLISADEALMRVSTTQLEQLLHPRFDEKALAVAEPLARGLNASPGAAVGQLVFDADRAVAKRTASAGAQLILVRPETTPDDIHGVLACKGVLTQRGGATSHAAVVARQLGIPCISGCEALHLDCEAGVLTVGSRVLHEGDWLSLDGTSGVAYAGRLSTMPASTFDDEPALPRLLALADARAALQVWANADLEAQALLARKFGAQGIGLCRTEHMFMGERVVPFRRAILATSEAELARVLTSELLPQQRGDFRALLAAMDGAPVIVRLLDPPLHEFLPSAAELRESGASAAECQHVAEMTEANPMLGTRGCRVGITRPAIYRMQVRALTEAAADVLASGQRVAPRIMIPLVSSVAELRYLEPIVRGEIAAVLAERGLSAQVLDIQYGTMIETPRAALTAGELAQVAEFASVGSNDCTQTTFGISRDDAEGKFLRHYLNEKIFVDNPFQTIDVAGVGRLLRMAVAEARETRPGMSIGICGEVGAEPRTIAFCTQIGLSYVSCSPMRIPVARLAAAQAVIKALQARS